MRNREFVIAALVFAAALVIGLVADVVYRIAERRRIAHEE